jgi:hypothetical protein
MAQSSQRLKGRPECLGDVLDDLVVEAHSRALERPSPKGLHSSPNVVNELRAATNQRLARADYGQVSLGVLTTVFDWVEQFRIHSCEAS